MQTIHIVGAGLAGAEAAWQVASLGVRVVIHEMRPGKMTPAHHTGDFAELVCSNSFKAKSIFNASGLLKEELWRLGSLILNAAKAHAVPAGQALAVDRLLFSSAISRSLREHPLVTIISEEVTRLPQNGNSEPWIIATGPLTSQTFADSLKEFSGEEYLYFYDAAAPVVTYESLVMTKVYRATRYDKGEADYLNCPMNEAEYHTFYEALTSASQHPLHDFETGFFEGCIPVEELARRGKDTLRFGPLKPVGLKDPKTGMTPYAVVQLRQDNVAADLYNLVGFQTNLRYAEQSRVFRLIPGLETADFSRYGMMHRNLFLNSPKLLNDTLQAKGRHDLFFAGQMIGVEGYIESAASGWLAGRNAVRLLQGEELITPPQTTMLGALMHYITHAEPKHFQPMNAVFGIMPPLQIIMKNNKKLSKKERQEEYAGRSLAALDIWQNQNGIEIGMNNCKT